MLLGPVALRPAPSAAGARSPTPSMAPPRTPDPLRSLAERAAGGDPEAVRSLVMELVGPMLRTVRKVLGAEHPDAEDVTQEAVLGLLRSLPRFRGESSVGHFGVQVALRTALHARRHLKVRAKVGDGGAELGDVPDPGAGSPHDVAVARERRRIVRELLDRLPEPTAEALASHFMLGYTVEEIALSTGTSPNTVWSRIKLGKRALARALADDPRLRELHPGRDP
jgi:RNA polymerase sigma factor (sigma-70 family)